MPRKKYESKKKSAVARLFKKVNRIERTIETKSKSTSTASANVTDSGTLYSITDAIAQGTSEATRTGDNVRVTSIWLNGHVSATSGATFSVVRFALVKSKIDQPAIADVFTNTYSAIDREVFKIIWEKTYHLDHVGEVVKTFKWGFKGKKMGNTKIEWDSSNNAVSGHYYLAVISNNAANYPLLTINRQVYYKG